MGTLKKISAGLSLGFAALAPCAAGSSDERRAEKAPPTTLCEMTYSLSGWSAFYKTANGHGTISCGNGQTADVTIKTKGGGVTFGKSEIVDGTGKFSEVHDISEVFGSYASAGAHAGAVKSSAAAVMTKGEVSLALAGTGRGVDVGFSFGKFTITKN